MHVHVCARARARTLPRWTPRAVGLGMCSVQSGTSLQGMAALSALLGVLMKLTLTFLPHMVRCGKESIRV